MRLFFVSISLLFSLSLHAQDVEIWGTTTAGNNSLGSIFSIDSNANSFEHELDIPGMSMRNFLCQFTLVSPDVIMGISRDGGEENWGGVFRYDLNAKEFNTIYNFGISNGNYPGYGLTLLPNGNVLGTTNRGGSGEWGVIYEYDVNLDSTIKRIEFDTATNGVITSKALMLASDNKVYGAIYEYDSSSTTVIEYLPGTDQFNVVYRQKNLLNGLGISGRLLEGSDGKLYGQCSQGGIYNKGTIFSLDLSDTTWTTLHHFNDTCGRSPLTHLVEAVNGRLFGITYRGGIGNQGVFYEYNTTLDTFICHTLFNGSNGQNSGESYLMAHSNGKVYGITGNGGTFNGGVIFEFDPSNDSYSIVKNFKYEFPEGKSPFGGLMEWKNNMILGSTTQDTMHNNGAIFSFNVNSNATSVIDHIFLNKGQGPEGKLIYHSNGKFYGSCLQGGKKKDGVLFSYDPQNDKYHVLHEFDENISGRLPNGELMVKGDMIFGTALGGRNKDGVLWSFNLISNAFKVRIHLSKDTTGGRPMAGLLDYGLVYGTTNNGGEHGRGTIFSFNPQNDEINIIHHFEADSNKGGIEAKMIQVEGMFYGVIFDGHSTQGGSLFSFDPVIKELTYLHHFDEPLEGQNPRSALSKGPGGKLYGVTMNGGSNYGGSIYSYDIALKNLEFEHYFDNVNSENGSHPICQLLWASNGKLYGTSRDGGSHYKGVLFEFDPSNGEFTKKHDFNTLNGSYPISSLTEINGLALKTEEVMDKEDLIVFPNPTDGIFRIRGEHRIQSINLYNINGQELSSFYWAQIAPDEIEIDLNPMNKNVYFIHITTVEGKVIIKKLVKS